MKKLMIALSAVALALGARADGITFPVGECFNDATEPSMITEPGESSISENEYSFSKIETIGTTDQWRDKTAGKNLAVKTNLGAPAYYAIGEAQTMPASGQAVMPLYFDSLVKFTYCDEDATVPTGSDAKLMVWVREDETAGTTNLMVTAGFYKKDVDTPEMKHYNCGPLSGYGVEGADDWCRLTIKAKGDITNGGNIPGFVVCVNGAPVTIAALPEGNRDIGEAGSATATLNAVDSFWHAENHLFPSMVVDDTISAVGFAGQGAVDDISFAKTEPTKADGMTTFCVDKAVASITWPTDGSLTEVKVGDKTMTLTDGAVSVPAGEPVLVDATAAEGWMITNGLGTVTIAADEVNKILTAAIVAMVEIGGETTPCASLEDAIGLIEVATADAKLTLNADAGAIAITAANEINVTIDLAGKTITPGAEDDWGIFVDGAAVTVTDTTTPVGTVNGGISGSVASTVDGTLLAGIFRGATAGVSAVLNGVKGDEDAKDSIDCLDDDQQWSEMDEDGLYTVIEKVIVKHNFILMIGENEYSRKEFEEGADIDVPDAPTSGLKGWQTFTQWQYQDGTPFEKITMGEADITIYAGTKFLDQDADENYLVQTAGDLIKLQAYVADGQDTTGKTFKQMADIIWTDQDGTFPGIGTYSNNASTGANNPGFKGTYDGDGKAIKNIKVASAKYAGIFTQLYGTVQNLTVENVYVDWTPDYNTKLNDKGVNAFTNEVGGAMVVSHVWGGTVKNVTTKGAFGSTEAPLTGSAGGVVCRVTGNATIENCVNEAALYGAAAKIAGIMIICQAGSADEGVVIKNCENKGSINWVNKDNNDVAGGYAGIAAYVGNGKKVKIEGCTNSGAITCALAGADVGQIVGKIQSGSVVADGTFTVAADQLVIGNKALDGFNFATIEESAVTLVADAALAVGGSYKVMSPRKGASDANKATATIAFTEAEQTVSFDQSLATAKFAITSTTGVIETNDVDNIITFTAKAPASPWPTPDPEKDEPEAVAEAMEGAGFSEASAVAIGTKANYTAFQGYCTEKGIIPSEVGAAKDNAVLTFALGAAACTEEITSEDITIEAYDQAAGKLTVKIDGVTAGETIRGDVLAKILTAKGGDELDGLDQNNVTVSGYAPADGEIEVSVAPDESFDNPTAFFYQIELKK